MLIAARSEDTLISAEHFESAVDRVIGGLEKKNKVSHLSICLLFFLLSLFFFPLFISFFSFFAYIE